MDVDLYTDGGLYITDEQLFENFDKLKAQINLILSLTKPTYTNVFEELQAKRPRIKENPDIDNEILEQQKALALKSMKEKEYDFNPLGISDYERAATPSLNILTPINEAILKKFNKKPKNIYSTERPTNVKKLTIDPEFIQSLSDKLMSKPRKQTKTGVKTSKISKDRRQALEQALFGKTGGSFRSIDKLNKKALNARMAYVRSFLRKRR